MNIEFVQMWLTLMVLALAAVATWQGRKGAR